VLQGYVGQKPGPLPTKEQAIPMKPSQTMNGDTVSGTQQITNLRQRIGDIGEQSPPAVRIVVQLLRQCNHVSHHLQAAVSALRIRNTLARLTFSFSAISSARLPSAFRFTISAVFFRTVGARPL
jgi:hypothetical protein